MQCAVGFCKEFQGLGAIRRQPFDIFTFYFFSSRVKSSLTSEASAENLGMIELCGNVNAELPRAINDLNFIELLPPQIGRREKG